MHGFASQAAMKIAASWTEAFAVGDTRLPIRSESLSKEFDKLRSSALVGQAAAHEFKNGHAVVQGDLVTDLDYSNYHLLYYAMGAGAGTIYSLREDADRAFHLHVDKYTERAHFAGCKINTMTIAGEVGSEEPITVTYGLACRSRDLSSTAFPTLAKSMNPAHFTHLLDCRVGDQANALDSGDEFAVKGFELVLDNNLAMDDKDSSSATAVIDPIRNGRRTAKLKLSLARYSSTNTAFNTWAEADTKLQAYLRIGNGTTNFIVNAPQMKVAMVPNWNVSGPGVITADVEFELFMNLDNAYMPTVENQFELSLV